jgi:hypothetical protein
LLFFFALAREVGVMLVGNRSAVAAALLVPLLLAGILGVVMWTNASANDCAAQCYAQENACRQANKGSPKCDVDLTRCLQACRKK